jgi:GNAT superfamily N-acetyltransferase
MKMTIRPAGIDDVPRLVDLGASFITQTGYAALLPINRDQMTALVERLLTSEDATLLVLETDAAVIGMLAMYCFPHPMSGERIASEVFWWVEPAARGHGLKLLAAAEMWAQTHGAAVCQMIAPTTAVERVYVRRGYVPVERLYQRRIALGGQS